MSRRLIPFLFVLYVVSFLDRVNVGFAALEMNRDLGFSTAVYGFGAGIFFIGYPLFEVPSNLILARVGARRWIARIMITWGLIATSMMFVRGTLSFYVLRFVLGIAEAGFFPGIIFYLSGWFPAEARARAIARFMTAIPVSGVIGGPISGALLPWPRWAVGAGRVAVALPSRRPSGRCAWRCRLSFFARQAGRRAMAGHRTRTWLAARLATERDRCVRAFMTSAFTQALSSGVVWQMGLLVFLSVSFGQYALSLCGCHKSCAAFLAGQTFRSASSRRYPTS